MAIKIENQKGLGFLGLALLAFAGLGIELIYAFLLEPKIYGLQMAEWGVGQCLAHWVLTSLTWGIIALGLVRTARQKYGFALFANKAKIEMWRKLGITLCVVLSLAVSYWDWQGFKIVKEFQYNGWLKFIFQYVYYAFETALVVLIVVFGQKAFEIWFGERNFPYGGIVLAATWGLVHIFTAGGVAAGLFTALMAILYGIVYLLTGRNVKATFPLLFIMFVL